jgi:hypothetical protein
MNSAAKDVPYKVIQIVPQTSFFSGIGIIFTAVGLCFWIPAYFSMNRIPIPEDEN